MNHHMVNDEAATHDTASQQEADRALGEAAAFLARIDQEIQRAMDRGRSATANERAFSK